MAAAREPFQFSVEQRTFCVLRYLDYKKIETKCLKRVRDEFSAEFDSHPPSNFSIQYWARKFEKFGTLHNQCSKASPGETHSGRKVTVLTPEKLAEVNQALQEDSLKPTDCPTVNSGNRNSLDLKPTSFLRATKQLGLHCYKPKVVHHQKDPDLAKRLDFARKFVQLSPERRANIAFSDEAGFSLDGVINRQNQRRYSPRGDGTPDGFIHTTSKFPQKVMVFLGLHSCGGTFGLKFYGQGKSLTGATYRELLINDCIPALKELNHDGLGTLDNMTWQQDGASIHTSNESIRVLHDSGFGTRLFSQKNKSCKIQIEIEWPPRSPDLNPLDFFAWGYLKSKVYSPKPKTLDELKARIEEAISNLDPDMVRRACDSLYDRCLKVIENNGGYIE